MKLDHTVNHTPSNWYPEHYTVGYEEGYYKVRVFLNNGTWHIRLGTDEDSWLDGIYEVTSSSKEEAITIAKTMLLLKQEGFSLKC